MNRVRTIVLSTAIVCLLSLALQIAALAQPPGGGPGHRPGVAGKVTSINTSAINVTTRDGEATIYVTASTTYDRNHNSASLSDFKVDDFVMAFGARDSAGRFVAERVIGGNERPQGPPPGPGGRGVGGQVTAVDASAGTLTIKGRDGQTQTIFTNAETKIMRNRAEAKLSDFKVGDFVMAAGEKNASGQFVANRIFGGDQPPQGPGGPRGPGGPGIGGELEAVDASAGTLRIKDRDGQSRLIYTDSNTKFVRNRQDAKLADFKAGDHVMASGKPNASGQFVADRVFGGDELPAAPGREGGRPRHPGAVRN